MPTKLEGYLKTAGYSDHITSEQLDNIMIKITEDWVNSKIDDETYVYCCEEFEATPEHHNMRYKEPLYIGLDLGYHLGINDVEEIARLKEKIKTWYRQEIK